MMMKMTRRICHRRQATQFCNRGTVLLSRVPPVTIVLGSTSHYSRDSDQATNWSFRIIMNVRGWMAPGSEEDR